MCSKKVENKNKEDKFKLVCKCGNTVYIQHETGIRENTHTLDNSEMYFQIKSKQVKILCDKCGTTAFISY